MTMATIQMEMEMQMQININILLLFLFFIDPWWSSTRDNCNSSSGVKNLRHASACHRNLEELLVLIFMYIHK